MKNYQLVLLLFISILSSCGSTDESFSPVGLWTAELPTDGMTAEEEAAFKEMFSGVVELEFKENQTAELRMMGMAEENIYSVNEEKTEITLRVPDGDEVQILAIQGDKLLLDLGEEMRLTFTRSSD